LCSPARRVPQLAEIAASIRAAGLSRPAYPPGRPQRADSAETVAQRSPHAILEPAFLVNNAGYGLLGRRRSSTAPSSSR